MAQSAESRIISASAFICFSVSGVPSPSRIRFIIRSSWGSPSRQGTHLPQVWFFDAVSMESCTVRGQVPGGYTRTFVWNLERSLPIFTSILC